MIAKLIPNSVNERFMIMRHNVHKVCLTLFTRKFQDKSLPYLREPKVEVEWGKHLFPYGDYQTGDKLFFVAYLNSSRIIPRYFFKLGNDVVSLHNILNLFLTNNSTIKTL
jgi:hypothetical protein